MNIDIANPLYWLPIGLILLGYLWSFIQLRLSDSMLKKPLPAEVADIYEPEAYRTWLEYRRDCRRHTVRRGAVMTLLTLLLFAFNVFSLVWNALGLEALRIWGGMILLVLFSVFSTLVGIPFGYYATFVIEEKYGFNRSTKKTFWLDVVKELVLDVVINCGLYAAVSNMYGLLGPVWMTVGVFGFFSLVMIVVSCFSLTFMKINNKFTPLEDGSLKQRLTALFEANGYRVRTVWVMDASRRTTRVNAFCTGLGKAKKVALFDNLVNNYTEDEITAVFAHELGHAKHRDTAVLTVMQLVIYGMMAAVIGLLCATPDLSEAMGFTGVNLCGVLIAVMTVYFEPLLTLLRVPANLISRRMERNADRFAAANGLGEPLVQALKRLSRDNFSNLNPHPFLSFIGDSHPTVAQRVRVLRGNDKKQN